MYPFCSSVTVPTNIRAITSEGPSFTAERYGAVANVTLCEGISIALFRETRIFSAYFLTAVAAGTIVGGVTRSLGFSVFIRVVVKINPFTATGW